MSKNPRTKDRYQSESVAEQPDGSSRSQNQEEANDKQGRLLSLAKELQKLFPEQCEELAQIIERVEKWEKVPGSSKQQTPVVMESEQSLIKSPPIAIPGKHNKAIKDRTRATSGGSTTSIPHDQQGEEEKEEEIDPRGRAPHQKDPLIHIFVDHSNILYGLPQPKSATPYRERRNTLPSRVDPPTATSSRPLPIPTGSNTLQTETQPLSRSVPTTTPLAVELRTTDRSREFEPDGDGVDRQKKKKPSRRLWYTAFILVLERGRPATRRVVVASKKPMETMPISPMEQFGYEVRVLTRVPDDGDGMDREQYKGKAGLSKVGHAQGISRSTSSESSSGKGASGAASTSLNPSHGKAHVLGSKVKYREQGVDEVLQLKLYQAITDPKLDDIPDGSTIVLATGDGGPGQFAEQGFLGPIKTALRGGWNVELCAWEDSLSRAWEREFGEEIKTGKFRIIGMKQFARWLSYDWA